MHVLQMNNLSPNKSKISEYIRNGTGALHPQDGLFVSQARKAAPGQVGSDIFAKSEIWEKKAKHEWTHVAMVAWNKYN